MRDAFSLSTLATFGNLIAGFSAVILVVEGDFARAAVLVCVAAVFDALDGAIARRSDRETELGANLDSLADIVSFGVAPALAIYLSVLEGMGMWGIAASSGYVVCGAFRLARFPLVKDGKRFLGLPIPPAGVAVSVLALSTPLPAVAFVALAFISILMVSIVPFPTLSSIPISRKHHDTTGERTDQTG